METVDGFGPNVHARSWLWTGVLHAPSAGTSKLKQTKVGHLLEQSPLVVLWDPMN